MFKRVHYGSMAQYPWLLTMMLLLTLLAAAAASTIPRLAPPDAIEYGFCGETSHP